MMIHDFLVGACAWVVLVFGSFALLLGMTALLTYAIQRALSILCRQLWAAELTARVVHELWRNKATWMNAPEGLVYFPPTARRAKRFGPDGVENSDDDEK